MFQLKRDKIFLFVVSMTGVDILMLFCPDESMETISMTLLRNLKILKSLTDNKDKSWFLWYFN